MPENIVKIQLEGEEWKAFLNKREFSTGSKGYHTQGRMQVGKKQYRINVLCVEVGSKPSSN